MLILLTVVCVVLYVLGGVLANHIFELEVQAKPANVPSVLRERGARLTVVLCWPSLAFSIAFDDEDA